jgi:hypothetical protein
MTNDATIIASYLADVVAELRRGNRVAASRYLARAAWFVDSLRGRDDYYRACVLFQACQEAYDEVYEVEPPPAPKPKPTPLRSIAGGSQWEDGIADEMRARLEEAIARDDRIAIFSVRRGHAGAEPATVVTATADRRVPCSVTWVEFVGALATKLHQWMGETESDDV